MSIKNFGGIVHIGTYNDHHKEATFHVPPGTNPADLIRAFMSESAEDVNPDDPTTSNASSSVNPESHSGNPSSSTASDNRPKDIPLFKYIHYSITSESERLDIHRQICNIVRLPKMQLVCDALVVLMKSQKILTTIDQSAMLTELRRLGLPSATTPGFSDQNFFSYYRTK